MFYYQEGYGWVLVTVRVAKSILILVLIDLLAAMAGIRPVQLALQEQPINSHPLACAQQPGWKRLGVWRNVASSVCPVPTGIWSYAQPQQPVVSD